jgi:hypothetical protein
VIAVTVRYRREQDEQGRDVVSWALVSFRNPSGAQAAMAAWAPQVGKKGKKQPVLADLAVKQVDEAQAAKSTGRFATVMQKHIPARMLGTMVARVTECGGKNPKQQTEVSREVFVQWWMQKKRLPTTSEWSKWVTYDQDEMDGKEKWHTYKCVGSEADALSGSMETGVRMTEIRSMSPRVKLVIRVLELVYQDLEAARKLASDLAKTSKEVQIKRKKEIRKTEEQKKGTIEAFRKSQKGVKLKSDLRKLSLLDLHERAKEAGASEGELQAIEQELETGKTQNQKAKIMKLVVVKEALSSDEKWTVETNETDRQELNVLPLSELAQRAVDVGAGMSVELKALKEQMAHDPHHVPAAATTAVIELVIRMQNEDRSAFDGLASQFSKAGASDTAKTLAALSLRFEDRLLDGDGEHDDALAEAMAILDRISRGDALDSDGDGVVSLHELWDAFRRVGATDVAEMISLLSIRNQLHGASLRNANFTAACLRKADLKFSDLTNACFVQADLTKVEMKSSLLNGTNLTDTILISSDLGRCVHGSSLVRVQTMTGRH